MRGRRSVALAALICSSGLLAAVLLLLGPAEGWGRGAVDRVVPAGLDRSADFPSEPATAAFETPEPEGPESATSVELASTSSSCIRGTVTDLDGFPIINATILAIEEPARPGDPFVDAFTTETTSDHDGSFSLLCGELGAHHLAVSAAGYATERTDACRAGDHLTVILSPGASLGGRVCTPESGDPVVGIEVRVGAARTVTDGDGGFLLIGLEPGANAFVATESSWNGWAGAFEPIDLVAGETAWVDLVLRDGVTVVGRVVDQRDYTPIAGARIGHRDGRLLATTDENGRYRIDGFSRIIDGDTPLLADAVGFAPEVGHPIERGAAIHLLNFALGPAMQVEGRVTDGTSPIARALVRVHPRRIGDRPLAVLSGTTIARPAEVLTSSDGTYRLTEIPAGAHRYIVEVRSAGHGTSITEHSLRGAGRHDLGTIALAPEARLEGIVVDELEAPLADLSITLRPVAASVPEAVARSTETDVDGIFRFGGLAVGRYELTGTGDGILLDDRFLEVGTAGDALTLTWVARSALEIDGLVIDRWQRPVEGVVVECTTEEGFPLLRTTQTDANGAFLFRGLPDGAYRLRVRGEDGRTGIVRRGVVPSDGCEVLVLEPLASVRGRVIDPDGFPCTGAFVVLLPPEGGFGIELRATVDAQGRFDFPVEAGHGEWRVVVWPSEAAWHETVVERGGDVLDGGGGLDGLGQNADPRAVVRRARAGQELDPVVMVGE